VEDPQNGFVFSTTFTNQPAMGENFMQSQRETTTDSLADIVNLIHLGGKSGTLTVERGEAVTLEEGLIVFVDGRVIEARVGQQSGLKAFNYLNTWKACRFSFIDHYTQDASMSSHAVQHTLSQRGSPPVASVSRSTTPLPPQLNNEEREYSGEAAGTSTGPLRSQMGEVALQHPERVQISRLQRRLLLLINGQRSPGELARLMVKSPNEIMMLLNDLERVGLIQQ
jgi:Domain of unknown function (DUF4388)